MCGENEHGTVTNCYNKGSVTGKGNVGGVCGINENFGIIENCYNTGNVSENGEEIEYVGGVCGRNISSGKVKNCYNIGSVTGKYYNVGGVCGNNYKNGEITNCYNTGSVTGSGSVGGVFGSGYSSKITNCYNTGSVTGKGNGGGVCGSEISTTITNCYYLEGTANGGIGGSDITGQAEKKTTAQFACGEVVYLLQEGQMAEEDGNIPQVWGQVIDKEGETKQDYPVLNKVKVYKAPESSTCQRYSNTEFADNANYNHTFITDEGKANATDEICSACGVVKNINYSGLVVTYPKMIYDGEAHMPEFSIKTGAEGDAATLKQGTDYEVVVDGKTDVSTTNYTATIKGKDDYVGERNVEWKITPLTLTDSMVSGVETSYYYTGEAIEPEVTVTATLKEGGEPVTLEKGKDYTVTYGNNTDVAESNGEKAPYVKITGKGNYAGEVTKNFAIAYISAPDDSVVGTAGTNGWYTSDVTIQAEDWSVSTDKKDWQESISVTEDGKNPYTLYLKNSQGYITDAISIKLDKTAPLINGIASDMKERAGKITVNVTDDTSGVGDAYFMFDKDKAAITEATDESLKKSLKASDYHNATGVFDVSGLTLNTTYYCAVLVVDQAGNESTVKTGSFTTQKENIKGKASISGNAIYGSTLKASYTGLAEDAGEVTVSWYRGDGATAIATGDTYT